MDAQLLTKAVRMTHNVLQASADLVIALCVVAMTRSHVYKGQSCPSLESTSIYNLYCAIFNLSLKVKYS